MAYSAVLITRVTIHALEREDEGQRADRADERLADVDPRRDEVGDGRDIGFAGEEKHVRLQVFSRHATGRGGEREPSLLRREVLTRLHASLHPVEQYLQG